MTPNKIPKKELREETAWEELENNKIPQEIEEKKYKLDIFNNITKDGHIMFIEDVIKDLNSLFKAGQKQKVDDVLKLIDNYIKMREKTENREVTEYEYLFSIFDLNKIKDKLAGVKND
jgi:hypothetical protein